MEKFFRKSLCVAFLATCWSLVGYADSIPDNFASLYLELQSRATTLTGSVDRVQQRQGRACLKAMAVIARTGTNLTSEAKTAGQVAKTLVKAFPSEFEPSGTGNLPDLLTSTYSNIVADVQVVLDQLQDQIDALPSGPGKDAAQLVWDSVQDLLNSVATAPDFITGAKILGQAIKGIRKIETAIRRASNPGGGGGGGGGGQGLACTINGVSFRALGATGTYANPTGQLLIVGATAQRSVSVSVVDVTGPGTYPAAFGSEVREIATGVTYAGNVTGTVNITTFNLAQRRAAGTFEFRASQTFPLPPNPSNVVNVVSGTFNVSNITIIP